jgi:hypothetical protein
MSDAYLASIPPRPESILKSAVHALNINDPLVHCFLSSMEAPSAALSVRMIYPDVEFHFNQIPTPDPREPMAEVSVVAWTYSGTTAEPSFPVPNQEFRDAISTEIGAPFALESWGDAAFRIASEFRTLTPCEMIGAMVFPALCPDNEWPWNWMFKTQLMCALVMSRRSVRNWATSPHGKHIYDIVHGPVDWTTIAGLLALTDIARRDPNSADDIRSMFFSLLTRPMSPIWFMCGYQPIWQMLQHFQNLDSNTLDKVRRTVDKLEADDDE